MTNKKEIAQSPQTKPIKKFTEEEASVSKSKDSCSGIDLPNRDKTADARKGKSIDEGKFYRIDILCKNCSEIVGIYIPMGITTEDFFDKKENQICSKCGCFHGRMK